MNKIVVFLGVSILAICIGSSVQADTNSEASQLFTEGIAAFEAEQYERAAELFRKANATRYNWKLLYNIAQAEAASGRYGIALETFETYVTEGGDKIPADRQDELYAEIKRLRNIVGMLEIESPDGCAVSVDGVPRGITPLPGSLLVSAGVTHDLKIEQDGGLLLQQEIKLNGGQEKMISVEADSVPPGVETAQRRSPLKTAGWILAATGGATLIAGAVTGGLAIVHRGDFYDKCGEDAKAACSPGTQNTLESSRTAGMMSTIMLPAGGVLAVTGIVLLVVAKKQTAQRKSAVSLRPLLGLRMTGLQLKASF